MEWFYHTYYTKINQRLLIYQMKEKASFLADYSIFSRAINFFLPLNNSLTKTIFSSMDKNSVLFG